MNPLPTHDMRRDFRDRADLIAYVAEQFPAAAAVDAHVAATRGGRAAALARLAPMDPLRYAQTRNRLDGAVTGLSPYLRHGVLSLAEARDAALAKVRHAEQASKLVNELGWRDYYQRVYAAIGTGVWEDLEPLKTGWRADAYSAELPTDIAAGETGLACMDAFARDLVTTGYLHNHARMWTAAYVVHWRRVRWQAGAAWFLTHLLDGDPASNNLSWQWVASSFSHKPYFFNRENLERNTGGVYCHDCPLRRRCPLDANYETLEAKLFPAKGTPTDPARNAQPSPHVAKLARVMPRPPASAPVRGPAVVWVHGDSLRATQPALAAHPEAPAIFVWDDALLTHWRISLKRLVFLYESLLELPVTIRRGDVAAEVARFAEERGATHVVTTDSPAPRFAGLARSLSRNLPVTVLDEPAFVQPTGPLDLRRFSRYWQRVAVQALDPG